MSLAKHFGEDDFPAAVTDGFPNFEVTVSNALFAGPRDVNRLFRAIG